MARADIKDIRPQQLIDATITVIGRQGFARTTLAAVAKQARLSPGIVGFYFKSKEALLLAALRHLADEYERVWMRAVADGPSPAAALEAMIEIDFSAEIANRRKVATWTAFWAESIARPDYARLVAELERAYFQTTAATCRALADELGRSDLDPDRVARGFNALLDGLWLDLLFDPTSFDREEAKRTCRLYLQSVFGIPFPDTARSAA